MAFSFGGQSTPAASSSAFSFNTPAFGAASAPAFSASSASAFGASSTPSLFGAAAPSPFGGAVSTPAFGFGGASSAPSLFGASSAPAFGAQSTPAFGAQSSAAFSLFGSAPAFGATSTPSLFGAAPAPTFALGQQQQQQQSLQQEQQLVTKDNHPLNHSTKWDDLSPQAQQYLLELEKVIAQCRDECRQLNGEERLQGAVGSRQGFGDATENLSRGIAAVQAMVHADTIDAGALRNDVMHLLRHTEAVLSSFKRTHAWREAAKVNTGQALPSHIVEQLGGPVALPSPFLSAAIKELEDKVKVQRAAATDLALALQRQAHHKDGSAVDAATALQSLQAAMSNLQDCLVHAAARLQALDEKVGTAKEVYLQGQRQAGDYVDPFSAADQEEMNRNRQGKVSTPKEHSGGQQSGANQGPGAAATGAMPAANKPLIPGATGLFGTVSPAPATSLLGTSPGATRRKTKRW